MKSDESIKPEVNAMIIGAGRSGTTTLYEYLKESPEICFSRFKEIHFFSFPDLFKKGAGYFHTFFPADSDCKLKMSADTYLLIDKDAPQRIKEYNPAMKFIIMLRHPVDRAYSSFLYAVNKGYESKEASFTAAFHTESDKLKGKDIVMKNNLGHFYSGLYHEHICYWMKFFPKENFLIIKLDDLRKDAKKELDRVSDFLSIEYINPPDVNKHVNKAAGARLKKLEMLLLNRNHWLRKFLRKLLPAGIRRTFAFSGLVDWLHRINKKEIPQNPITDKERNMAMAMEYFEKDLVKLKQDFNIGFD